MPPYPRPASRFTPWLTLGLALIALTGHARADTVVLGAAADTTLFEESPEFSNGAGSYSFVGLTDMNDARRALMRFDLASIPAGSTITAVTLSLYCSRAKQNTDYAVNVHRLSAAFGEAGSNASGEEGTGTMALSGDSTWTYRTYATVSWATPGGDFVATPSATALVGRNGERDTWSSAGMVVDVQAWLDAPATNHGWILIGNEVTARSAKRFDTRESTTVSQRPILTVTYTPPALQGACCAANGSCSEVSSAACVGIYQGNATLCSMVTCPQPTGACCATSGACSVSSAAACTGAYEGDATSCDPNPCPVPDGACCAGDGSCTLVSDPGGACVGEYQGAATSCDPNLCMAQTGACCAADGGCSVVLDPGGACVGTYSGLDSVCSPNTCPQPTGACCAASGACSLTTAAACGDVFQGAASSCDPNVCPQPMAACCSALGDCTLSTAAACTGTFQAGDLSCTPDPCPAPTGACCAADGGCSAVTSASCVGAWQGALSVCSAGLCPAPTGACCANDGSCVDAASGECSGAYQGDATACASTSCPLVLERYVDPLPLPAPAVPTTGMSGGAAEYSIAIRQIYQRLHRDLPPTKVWVYDDGTGGGYPGPTIEARSGQPVRVRWLNDLRDEGGAFLTDHFLPVDHCLHGGHWGGTRVVTHLHGGHVPSAFDGQPEETITPGESVTYDYPNAQDAAMLWYHDHALGITRLNVYAGLAALYVVRDANEDALSLPRGQHEVPLVIQDRTFRPDGSLVYPAAWEEHTFGEVNLVNGAVTPYLEVARGLYRFRMLNGANARTYTLSLSEGTFTLIGNDGGLLTAPVTVSEITLGPAERADVIVDFSALPAGTRVLLQNSAPAPYPGVPGVGVLPDIMEFRVTSAVGHTDPLPTALRAISPLATADSVITRDFELARGDTDTCGHRAWRINNLAWDDITERPRLGTTEIWRFVNRSGIAHPMHLHLVFFQVLDRQPFDTVDGVVTPIGTPTAPLPWERGWKDTVTVNANEIVRVIARFEDYTGPFPYHCHVLEHEDHEMMRQFVTTTVCGDGTLGMPDEECDDGNTLDGDGCSAACALEEPEPEPMGGGGCGCRAAGESGTPWALGFAMVLVGGLLRRRMRRGRCGR